MKRVYCLYRVSTLGQVEKDDIPMQRQACHAFAEKQGWQIIAEFSEKGVSGFKQSAEQREALVAIKQAAILKKFDVLLVFMFDRLGRRDDETPFVVEWFVKNGIAVWSVMEGEQRFENHVDKLLNYIRFWQSSGESIKTALRTRVRMEQLIQENGYVGGTAPYGYRLCKLGRVNKRGFEVHDLLMDPAKAEVIKTIFRLYCEEDMGPYRIAVHLTQQGELTRRGTQWNAASVRNILGNAIYTGIRTYRPLLLLLDESKKIGQLAAYEISFIENSTLQACIHQVISQHGATVSKGKAKLLREEFEQGKLDQQRILELLACEKPAKPDRGLVSVRLPRSCGKYFSEGASQKEISEILEKALDFYFQSGRNTSSA